MDASYLTLYKSPFKKIRLGKDNDGGYIVCDIPDIKYDVLISGGIDNDISFEKSFVQKYNTDCYAFDGTINSIESNENIHFIKKNIDNLNTQTTTNLHELINAYNNIFIKMDIEGSEYKWIDTLTQNEFDKICQIVIEFHYPTKRENNIFKLMNEYFYLLHFHSNNYCGYIVSNNISIPNVFECTYVNKKYVLEQPELNTETLPMSIDMRNIPYLDDYFIDYPPFVN